MGIHSSFYWFLPSYPVISFPKVQLYLNVLTLSDITSIDGINLKLKEIMYTSKQRPQSNYHKVTQQKPPESSSTKWFKLLICFGNIVTGKLTTPLLYWTEKGNKIKRKYLFYYNDLNQQKFIPKANETF